MINRNADEWADLGEALAFLGNSLLSPMNQTGTVGLEPSFWAEFPTFGDEQIAEALRACEAYADAMQAFAANGGDAVQRVSVEYTKLFVGPPRPAAAPWETMYRAGSEGTSVGFGQATFEMQQLLRDAGLAISNENNQYADHIGIELLLASVLCTRASEAAGDEEAQAEIAHQLGSFLDAHPRAWIADLAGAVEAAQPAGYISRLLSLAEAILAWDVYPG